MIFKCRYEHQGGHVYCRLFAAKQPNMTFASCGVFTVRVEGFEDLQTAMPGVLFVQAQLEAFEQHGVNASVHYADDTGKEWQAANREKTKALAIFDAHPELQPEMRKIATGFLWSLKSERPPETQS